MKKEIYQHILNKDDLYILIGTGMSKYDCNRGIFTESAISEKFDVVYLEKVDKWGKTLYFKKAEFKYIFEKDYIRLSAKVI